MTVRELIVKIGFKTDKKNLSSIGNVIGQFKDKLMNLHPAVAIIASTALALHQLTVATAALGDSIAKTSKDIGIAGEDLQRLQYAGDLAGISVEEMNTNLKFFTKNLGGLKTGSPQAALLLNKLGVSVLDASGNFRNSKDIILDLAEKMKDIEDPAERARISTELFGRSGLRMGQFLGQGAEEIKKAGGELESFGQFFNERQLALSEEFSVNVMRVHTALKGLGTILGNALMPLLNGLYVAAIEIFKAFNGGIAPVINDLAGLISFVLLPVIDDVGKILAEAFTFVLGPIQEVVRWITLLLKIALAPLMFQLKAALSWLLVIIRFLNHVFQPLFKFINDTLGAVQAFLDSGIMKLFEVLQKVFEIIEAVLFSLWDFLVNKIAGAFDFLFNKIFGIEDAFKIVVENVKGFFASMINGIIDTVNWLIEKVNTLTGKSIGLISRFDPAGDAVKKIENSRRVMNNTFNVNNTINGANAQNIGDKITSAVFQVELQKILVASGF